MKHHTRLFAGLAASILLAACSTSNSAPPTPGNPGNPGAPGASVLQFAAGNLTMEGIAGVAGINVVSTLRGKSGASALLSDTPTITGPFTFGSAFSAAAGNAGVPSSSLNPPGDGYATAFGATPSSTYLGAPSLFDASLNQMTGTPQTLHLGAPACDTTSATAPIGYTSCSGTGESTPSDTTFGFSGGVFVNGLQPANSTENSKPYSFAPYPLPMFSTSTVPLITPWGGPPAFDDQKDGLGYRDGQHAAGLFGAISGLTAFQLPAGTFTSGTFAMSDLIYTGGQSTATLGPITSTVNTGKALPVFTPAETPTFTYDGNGGLNVTVPAFPAGVTEEYVWVIDDGPVPASVGKAADANCQDDLSSGTPVTGSQGTSIAPVYYTLVFTAPGTYAASSAAPTGGTTNVGLADLTGPNNDQKGATTISPTPSVCTAAQNSKALGIASPGDSIQTITYGLDYDMYGASAPKNTSQTPAITGSSGEDDMTISTSATSVSP